MESTKPAPDTTQATSGGLCDNCVSGHVFNATATGTEKKIGPFETVYIAQPPVAKNPSAAIVIFTDVFGLKLINNKILADQLAHRTGITVYVPDLFYGDALPANALPVHETAEAARNEGLLAKLKKGGAIATHLPWFVKNRPTVHIPATRQFIDQLKVTEYGHTKFGAVGYCYGAKFVANLNAAGITACSVLAHPSLIGKDDLTGLQSPTAFALAEFDSAFPDAMRDFARTDLEKRKVVHEFKSYEGTTHGFAARGDLKIEMVKKGWEGALNQTSDWFKKYLLAG